MARIGLNALVVYTGSSFRNAGVSRYCGGLIRAVLREPSPHTYRLFLNDSAQAAPFTEAGPVEIRRTALPTSRTPVRILWEQLAAPGLSVAGRLDLLHSCLNVVPLAAPTRHVVEHAAGEPRQAAEALARAQGRPTGERRLAALDRPG